MRTVIIALMNLAVMFCIILVILKLAKKGDK